MLGGQQVAPAKALCDCASAIPDERLARHACHRSSVTNEPTMTQGLKFCYVAAQQDVLPALLHTLAPQVRPVVERLLQPSERAALADVTDSMLAYGLRYAPPAPAPVFAQQQNAAPATNLPLKPPVDRLCAYQVSVTSHLPSANEKCI